MSLTNTEANLVHWSTLAQDLPSDFRPRMPYATWMNEALAVAVFVETHTMPRLDPVTNKEITPGLNSINTKKKTTFDLNTAVKIRLMHDAVSEAHFRYSVCVKTERNGEQLERAREVYSEIRDALWFVLEGGNNEAELNELASVDSMIEERKNVDDLAHALSQYARLARTHQSALEDLGSFNVELIDEANNLSTALIGQKLAMQSQESTELRKQRNRLMALLNEEISEVRRVAKYVFRKHPSIVKEALSAFERKARARVSRESNDAPTNPNNANNQATTPAVPNVTGELRPAA